MSLAAALEGAVADARPLQNSAGAVRTGFCDLRMTAILAGTNLGSCQKV
jgi:hypothetical protein